MLPHQMHVRNRLTDFPRNLGHPQALKTQKGVGTGTSWSEEPQPVPERPPHFLLGQWDVQLGSRGQQPGFWAGGPSLSLHLTSPSCKEELSPRETD